MFHDDIKVINDLLIQHSISYGIRLLASYPNLPATPIWKPAPNARPSCSNATSCNPQIPGEKKNKDPARLPIPYGWAAVRWPVSLTPDKT